METNSFQKAGKLMKTSVATKETLNRHSSKKPSLLDNWLDALKIVSVDRIRSENDYDRVAAFMEEVIKEIGKKKKHPLCALLDILEMRIREFDDAHHPMDDVTGLEILKFLVAQHGLKQKDLSEIGSQGVVSEILSGKRELNIHHIKLLAKRFNVPPTVFLPSSPTLSK